MNTLWKRATADFRRKHPDLAHLVPATEKAAQAVANCGSSDGLILICGNGGSAADSEHIAAELVKPFSQRRGVSPSFRARLVKHGLSPRLADRLQPGIRAVSLCAQASALTAILNDEDPALVFAQQVCAYGRQGDVLIALSTSGNSPDIVAALQTARAARLTTIGLSGSKVSAMDSLCDILIKVPADATASVQELHMPVYHLMCRLVDIRLASERIRI